MKKFLVVILVLCAITPVFAGLSGDIGMATGYDFFFFKGNNADKFQQIQGVPLGIKGSLYFGDGSLAMGLDYGLDFFKYPIKMVYNGVAVNYDDADANWFLQPRAGFGIRYAFNDIFALKGAVGGSFFYNSESEGDVKTSHTMVGIYADLGLSVSMGPVALLGGVKADFTVNNTKTQKAGNISFDQKVKGSFIDVAPYVGIGYSF